MHMRDIEIDTYAHMHACAFILIFTFYEYMLS